MYTLLPRSIYVCMSLVLVLTAAVVQKDKKRRGLGFGCGCCVRCLETGLAISCSRGQQMEQAVNEVGCPAWTITATYILNHI